MKLNELAKKSFNNKLIFAQIFLIFIIFLLIIKPFSSVDNIYMLNNYFFLNKSYFNEDIFLKNSTLFKYPFYYELLKFFKINIDYDLHAFILHLFLHFVSFYFLFLTIKKIFPKFDKTLLILIILALSSGKASFLLNGVMSNIIISHTSTPTAFASSLSIIFLYFLVSRKLIGIIFIPLFSLLISIKSAWFTVGISIFYSLFYLEKKKKLIAIFPIIFSIIFLFKDLNFLAPLEENIRLYEFAFNREYYATMFSKQSFFRIFIFLISFPFFYFLVKKIEDAEIKKIFKLVIIFQFILFIFLILLEIVNIDFFKKWQLIAISPVRSTAFYELGLKIILISLILNIYFNKKNILLFPLIFCSIFFFGFGNMGNILGVIFLVLFLSALALKSKVNLDLDKISIVIITAFLVLPSALYINYKLLQNKITTDYYKNEKRIFLKALPKNKYRILSKYKNCEDFLFHDTTGNFYSEAQGVYLDITKIKNWSSNSIIKKSLFFVDPVFLYGNLELLNLNQINYEIIAKIHKSIKENKKFEKDFIDLIKQKKLIILIKSSDKKIFDDNFTIYDDEFGFSFVLINYQLSHLNNCQ